MHALQTPSAETVAHAKTLNRHVLGPGALAEGEWAALGLPLPDVEAMRAYRLQRVRAELRRRDYAAIVLFDPLHVRYATDSTNMQLWITHNAGRYAFIAADGPVILFDYDGCEHLSGHLDLIDEIRPAIPWFYFAAGERIDHQARAWGAEIAALVTQWGGGNRRLAVDRCNPEGLGALARHGVEVHNGEAVMETAREIKCAAEIAAMRCAIAACDRAVAVMARHLAPGISEQQLWGHLHAESIARGGEWIETRLMASGPRTNPWFQECSSRIIEAGDLVAFDTDLIGAYGMCVDISRTWLCGDGKPSANQGELHRLAHEQILANTEWLRPGLSYRELTHHSLQYDPETFYHYSCLYHGVGLCDEAPCIYFPPAWEQFGYDGVLAPGMVVCVESYVGRRSGGEGVKLENQVLITDTGHEVLSHYPLALAGV
ncbi:MAG: M24 family metallopeptidase [Candidatus Competibacterales bacterium]